jgi:hypothetical protein
MHHDACKRPLTQPLVVVRRVHACWCVGVLGVHAVGL